MLQCTPLVYHCSAAEGYYDINACGWVVLLMQSYTPTTLCASAVQEAGSDNNKTSLARSAAEKLVNVALQRGTADNVTALVMLPHWTK